MAKNISFGGEDPVVQTLLQLTSKIWPSAPNSKPASFSEKLVSEVLEIITIPQGIQRLYSDVYGFNDSAIKTLCDKGYLQLYVKIIIMYFK